MALPSGERTQCRRAAGPASRAAGDDVWAVWAALRRLADPVAQLVVWFGLLVVSKDMGSNPDRLGNGAPQGATDVERYVSRRELASIMGVSLATVDRMVAEGLPSVTWGRRTRRFKPSMAISWATERGTAA
jgi:hypothetical protein